MPAHRLRCPGELGRPGEPDEVGAAVIDGEERLSHLVIRGGPPFCNWGWRHVVICILCNSQRPGCNTRLVLLGTKGMHSMNKPIIIALGAMSLSSLAPAVLAQDAPPSYQGDPSVYKVIFEDQNFRVISI